MDRGGVGRIGCRWMCHIAGRAARRFHGRAGRSDARQGTACIKGAGEGCRSCARRGRLQGLGRRQVLHEERHAAHPQARVGHRRSRACNQRRVPGLPLHRSPVRSTRLQSKDPALPGGWGHLPQRRRVVARRLPLSVDRRFAYGFGARSSRCKRQRFRSLSGPRDGEVVRRQAASALRALRCVRIGGVR